MSRENWASTLHANIIFPSLRNSPQFAIVEHPVFWNDRKVHNLYNESEITVQTSVVWIIDNLYNITRSAVPFVFKGISVTEQHHTRINWYTSLSATFVSNKAVSYTHLDVYKRQIFFSKKLPCVFFSIQSVFYFLACHAIHTTSFI